MTLSSPAQSTTIKMQCWENGVQLLSCGFILAGASHLVQVRKSQASYGRYLGVSSITRKIPARVAWFFQELPALVVPLLMLLLPTSRPSGLGRTLLLGTFCLHYFQRVFVYSLLTKGQPFPLAVMLTAGLFCTLNGFLQAHYLLHCAQYEDEWASDYRFVMGLMIFVIGLVINIHSDYILRNLRKSGEVVYKIPKGGLFEFVSGANYFGEILEWFGYAIATWSLPTLSFALFSLCFIGPRAYHHHSYYHEHFKDYPKLRRALFPFIF